MAFQRILENEYVTVTVLKPFQHYSKALRKKFNGALPFRLSSENVGWITPHGGLLIPKYSALQKLFASVTIRLKEAGIIENKITGQYLYFWQPPEKPELGLKPIGLPHIVSGVYISIVGLIFSLVAFIGEFLASSKFHHITIRKSRIRVQPMKK